MAFWSGVSSVLYRDLKYIDSIYSIRINLHERFSICVCMCEGVWVIEWGIIICVGLTVWHCVDFTQISFFTSNAPKRNVLINAKQRHSWDGIGKCFNICCPFSLQFKPVLGCYLQQAAFHVWHAEISDNGRVSRCPYRCGSQRYEEHNTTTGLELSAISRFIIFSGP